MLPPADFKGAEEKLVNVVGTVSGCGLLLLKYDLFFLLNKESIRVGQSSTGGGPQPKRCLCAVRGGLRSGALWTSRGPDSRATSAHGHTHKYTQNTCTTLP